jgi:hypothetical protein
MTALVLVCGKVFDGVSDAPARSAGWPLGGSVGHVGG